MKIAYVAFSPQLVEFAAHLLRGLRDRGHTTEVFITHPMPGGEVPWYLAENKVTVEAWSWFELKGLNDFKPDLILMWNGYAPWTHAAMLYLEERYEVLHLERGWLPQEGNCYIADSLATHSEFIMDLPVQIPINHEGIAALEKLYKPRYTDHGLPERFIFVPAQLDEDTSITISSPIFKTCDSFMGAMRHFIPDVPIIVKNHPLLKDKNRPKSITLYDGPLSSMDLAAQATVVAGLTSTVLTEALIYPNPVACFGYNVGRHSHMDNQRDPEITFRGINKIIKSECLWVPTRSHEETLSWLLSKQWDQTNPPKWVYEYIERLTPPSVILEDILV